MCLFKALIAIFTVIFILALIIICIIYCPVVLLIVFVFIVSGVMLWLTPIIKERDKVLWAICLVVGILGTVTVFYFTFEYFGLFELISELFR